MRPLLDAVEAVRVSEDGVELYACVGGGSVEGVVEAELALDCSGGLDLADVEDGGLGCEDGFGESLGGEWDDGDELLLRGLLRAACTGARGAFVEVWGGRVCVEVWGGCVEVWGAVARGNLPAGVNFEAVELGELLLCEGHEGLVHFQVEGVESRVGA